MQGRHQSSNVQTPCPSLAYSTYRWENAISHSLHSTPSSIQHESKTLPSPKISLRWKDKLPHPHLCWATPEWWALRWVPTKVPTLRFLALQHPIKPDDNREEWLIHGIVGKDVDIFDIPRYSINCYSLTASTPLIAELNPLCSDTK